MAVTLGTLNDSIFCNPAPASRPASGRRRIVGPVILWVGVLALGGGAAILFARELDEVLDLRRFAAPPTEALMSTSVDAFARTVDDAERDESSSAISRTAPLQPAARLRAWFPETLLWAPEVITGADGRAAFEVPLADTITTWRVQADAISTRGLPGTGTARLTTVQKFFADLNPPGPPHPRRRGQAPRRPLQ